MSNEPRREFFDRVQPKIQALAVELSEADGLRLDQVADAFMSCAIALAVGIAGREPTVMHLATISRGIMLGRYDNAASIESGPLQ